MQALEQRIALLAGCWAQGMLTQQFEGALDLQFEVQGQLAADLCSVVITTLAVMLQLLGKLLTQLP